MKGDFSRPSVEQQSGYSGVLMQQGRVQLDADWNEQVAITRRAIETRTRDMLGPAGAPADQGGFEVKVSDAPTDKEDCTLTVGQGHIYVDGLLCENTGTATAVFTSKTHSGEQAACFALAYLDVWERHVTALEDERLREPALGGPDTATRTQIVWKLGLLTFLPPPGVLPKDSWQTVWKDFVESHARQAHMAVHIGGKQPANQLYRVEIHDFDHNGPRFKWSRENGAVTFPIVAVEAREDKGVADAPAGNGGAPAGNQTSAAGPAPAAASAVAVYSASDTARLKLTVLHLDRDPQALVQGDTVEIEDDLSAYGRAQTVLGIVTHVSVAPGEGAHLGKMVGEVVLRSYADPHDLPARAALLDEAVRCGPLRPVLRRWDRPDNGPRPDGAAELALTSITAGVQYRLERGITISFATLDHLRPGDYWQFCVRENQEEREEHARLADGPGHHYAPLALIERGAAGWHRLEDLRLDFQFQTITALTAALEAERRRSEAAEERAAQLRAMIEFLDNSMSRLARQIEELHERATQVRRRIEQECEADAEIAQWSVVSADSERPNHIELACRANASLVIGVVAEVPGPAGPTYRVVSSGRARCQVKGRVRPGDTLVVSNLPGHARRAGLLVRPGTLLGKALGAITPDDDDASGLVDVMVMLG